MRTISNTITNGKCYLLPPEQKSYSACSSVSVVKD